MLHTRFLLSQFVDDLRQVQTPDYETTRRNTLDWQNSADLGAQQLTFGGLLSGENTRSSVYGTNFDVDTWSQTWYVEDRASFGASRLLAALGYTRHETFGDHMTWNAEYGYAAGAATLLTASFGTAFRAPDSTDRYGYDGNPALKPESLAIFVGLRERLSAHQILTLSAFENRIDDLIQYVAMPTLDNPYNGVNENVDRARIRGLEAGWDYVDQDWQARLAGSRQDPVDRLDGSAAAPGQGERHAVAHAPHRRRGVRPRPAASCPRADIDNYGDPVHDGGYTLVNLFWRTTLSPGLALGLKLENALDKRYQVAYGYNTMGRGRLRLDAVRFPLTAAVPHGSQAMGNRLSRIYTRTGDDGTTGLATARASTRTRRASRPTARSTRRTPPSAWYSPCRACRRRSAPASPTCSTTCSTSAPSCASPATAS